MMAEAVAMSVKEANVAFPKTAIAFKDETIFANAARLGPTFWNASPLTCAQAFSGFKIIFSNFCFNPGGGDFLSCFRIESMRTSNVSLGLVPIF